ncbi:PIR protein [Plasmodium vivax]|uniref:VIR protein n=1 Tax=Plasmodium vivax TaxID=5855 RepID=A0A565A6D1_PLAVI|nr:PIR protein [Plasmodium vivax]
MAPSEYKEIFHDSTSNYQIFTSYCSNYKSYLQDSDENKCSSLESECSIICKYINLLEQNHAISISEGCKFLYYMMYDKYIENQSSGCNMLEFYKASLKSYCENGDWEECNNFVEQIDVHLFEKYNNLIVLCEQFDKLINSGDNEEPNKCGYAKKCVELYEKYIKECLGGVNNYYCNELKNFKHDYEKKIKELTCADIATILTSSEFTDLASIIIFTPFGSWLSLQMDRKKNKYRNIENVTQKYIHSPKPTEGNFQNRPYNVSYNSGQY